MLSALKRVVPPGLRHRLIHFMPSGIRHSLVDYYIARQSADLNSRLESFGNRWHETLPNAGWLAGNGAAEDKITTYWESEVNRENLPSTYANSIIRWDIDWLNEQISRLLPAKGTVLDFGCNAGRVLRVFVEKGYRGIGVEINPQAVAVGKRLFPCLERATFHIGEGSVALRNVATGSVDVIYTCAVLRHVAPENIDAVLAEFARIAPRHVITLEDEGSFDCQNFPHDYRAKFRRLGFVESDTLYAIDLKSSIDIGGIGTMFRVYARRS